MSRCRVEAAVAVSLSKSTGSKDSPVSGPSPRYGFDTRQLSFHGLGLHDTYSCSVGYQDVRIRQNKLQASGNTNCIGSMSTQELQVIAATDGIRWSWTFMDHAYPGHDNAFPGHVPRSYDVIFLVQC